VPDGTHHLLRDKEDAATNDGADHDCGGLREAKHPLERLMFAVVLRAAGGVRRRCGDGDSSGERVSA
jgi:hypothetical protein